MMKMTLNLHFVLQLMLHLRMFELALEKNFQSHNKTTLFSGQINMAKLAPPKRFPTSKSDIIHLFSFAGAEALSSLLRDSVAITMARGAAGRGRRRGKGWGLGSGEASQNFEV